MTKFDGISWLTPTAHPAYIKDEGDFFTIKLLPNGQTPDPHEMYEFGHLKEHTFTSIAKAKEFCKSKNLKYKLA